MEMKDQVVVEQAMDQLTEKMKQTDQKLDDLALQVGEILGEGGGNHHEEVHVGDLLKSVNEVKANYQHLREDLVEVQDLQKQLSVSLQYQLRAMQVKFDRLKEKICSSGVPNPLTNKMAANNNK